MGGKKGGEMKRQTGNNLWDFLSIGEGVCQGRDEGGAGNEVLPQGGRRDCARGREVSGGQPSHPRHIGFQE